MVKDNLETRCKKAVLRIADTVQDISMKLCHLIESYKDRFYGDFRKHNCKNSKKAYNNCK